MRDLNRSIDRDSARPYEDLSPPPSEAELLHYINFKLGKTNELLGQIKTLLVCSLIATAGIIGALWRKGLL